MIIPCDECVTKAMCLYKHNINCKILSTWVRNYYITNIETILLLEDMRLCKWLVTKKGMVAIVSSISSNVKVYSFGPSRIKIKGTRLKEYIEQVSKYSLENIIKLDPIKNEQ
jgi:hypothetical protein